MKTVFHLSLPCYNVLETKNFYTDILGAQSGRESENWVDINLYGHQMTFAQVGNFSFHNPNYVFEKKILPSFHFGIILDFNDWESLYIKMNRENLDIVAGTTFLKNKPGEHISFFVKDPNGFMIEFKSFRESDSIFTK